ncbi:hypothetical protein PV325_001491 [Microctonus aethiopoides]|uniref:BHLH domain-containing protein n=1 Tax=Microctonus aethiopoides TaxID=144406 RepID=A0AA39KR75_9HYME|nr:hypothetical protein PV325_001491 [Microctonus aethiopoides]KAK0083291.1 hypothetical protein PV326_006816 [Microctonus aethiopoides]KAK0170769.1 hypothetical protein PV328_008572 [Microctonus aethiopoides]
MSDDDRDIDIESDEGEDSDSRQRSSDNTQFYSQAEKRAHHNALERKRRDHIKDSFSNLRDTVVALKGGKGASRVQILKEAAQYINLMRKNTKKQQQDIDDLKRQNVILNSQIVILERALTTGNFAAESYEGSMSELINIVNNNNSESESSDSETDRVVHHPKKLKITTLH